MATTGLFTKLRARIHRDASIGVERTLLYKAEAATWAPVADDRRLTIAPIEAMAIASLAGLGPFDAAECAARLERGDRCYGAWVGGKLAHYSWAQSEGVHSLDPAGMTVAITPGELWIYNCRTSEEHRGRGLYPATLRRLLADYFAEGATCAWIYCAEGNIASQRGIERAGFTSCGTLRALRIGRYFRALGENALVA